jgi:integrase/recombinase XerC/integrase/recombinase XerD
VEWYREVLGRLQRWLEADGRPTRLRDIDDMTIREFIVYFQQQPGTKGPTVSSHTVYNRVNALRSFFGWLYRQGYTRENVLANMKQPKTTKIIIEPLTDEEIGSIFKVIKTYQHESARNIAMVALMLDTSLRIMEVAGLREDDLHLKEQYIKVMGKGAKEWIIAFGSATLESLLHYGLAERPEPGDARVEVFFLNREGYHLTPDSIRSIFKRLSVASGIKRLHPHLVRHTYATMFLLNGGNVFLLQQNLGHTTLAMVQKYVHFASQTAAIQSQEFSPMDRLRSGGGSTSGNASRSTLQEAETVTPRYHGRERYRW